MTEETEALTLEAITDAAEHVQAVSRTDLRVGDWVVVTTRNSVYSLCLLEDGSYSVAGGWFDRAGLSPKRIGVAGCTFGGRAIRSQVIAAPGLFLEFENSVTTTRILDARVLACGREAVH